MGECTLTTKNKQQTVRQDYVSAALTRMICLKEDQSMKKMKPIIKKMDGITNYYCPKCKRIIVSTWNLRQSGTKDNYCRECGQGMDWSGITLEVYWVD